MCLGSQNNLWSNDMCNLNLFMALVFWKRHIITSFIQKMHNIWFSFSLIIQVKQGHDINIETPNFFTLGKKRKLLVHKIASSVKLQKMDNDPYTYSITYSRNNSESGWITTFPIRWQEKGKQKRSQGQMHLQKRLKHVLPE